MTLSLNEINATCKRAARGAGHSWGLAEEAGYCGRWLAGRNLPGALALAGLLTRNDGIEYDQLCPGKTSGEWRKINGQLCPLITGAAISDLAAEIARGREITLIKVSYPILLLPFVAAASGQTNTPMTLTWSGVTACFSPDLSLSAPIMAELTADVANHVQIKRCNEITGDPVWAANRGEISPGAAEILATFGHRTYAPDTAQSRLSGAGAGLSDND